MAHDPNITIIHNCDLTEEEYILKRFWAILTPSFDPFTPKIKIMIYQTMSISNHLELVFDLIVTQK